MGLDAVELVMAIEEKFGIEISDPEAQKVLTVGDMQRLVLSKLSLSDEKTCLTQQAFYLVRRTAMKAFGISRKSLRPDTPLASFIPKENRRRDWLVLETTFGPLPELERPKSVSLVLTSLVVVPVVAMIWYGALTNALGAWMTISVLVAVGFGWTCAELTKNMKTEFSDGYSLVRDIARIVVAKHPELLHRSRSRTWTEEEVRCLLREVIIEQLGVTEFNDNSRFVADLHID